MATRCGDDHLLISVFFNVGPQLYHLRGPPITSTTGSNWWWCCCQFLPDWEARCDTTNTVKRREAFLSAWKVHTGALPAEPGLLPLPVSLPGGGDLGTHVYHQTPPQVRLKIQVPPVEWFSSLAMMAFKVYQSFVVNMQPAGSEAKCIWKPIAGKQQQERVICLPVLCVGFPEAPRCGTTGCWTRWPLDLIHPEGRLPYVLKAVLPLRPFHLSDRNDFLQATHLPLNTMMITGQC